MEGDVNDDTYAFTYALYHAAEFREQLKELLRIPSVGSDPTYAEHVKQAADRLASDPSSIGLRSKVIAPKRHPLVYGEWLGAGVTSG